jgi:hypothetical protein
MSKEIIYSIKEYQEKYNSSLDKYFLEYKEIEELDFINDEIEKYNICLRLVNFPIDKIFNTFWRVEYGINLKSFTISQETYDFIFADENDEYYYKIYNDIVKTSRTSGAKIDIEKKIKQARLMFAKIISFLETKKSGHGTNYQMIMKVENTLNWQGSKLEFTELTKALILSKKLNAELTDKEIFKRLKTFLNIEEFNHNDKIKDIRSRTKDLTPFINILETSLTNDIKNK